MKKLIIGLALLILAGCGDTINQGAASAGKLVVKSGTYGLYSTHGSTFSTYSSNGLLLSTTTINPRYWLDGKLDYSGDPQGVVVSMAGNPLTYFPSTSLMPGNKLHIWLDMAQREVVNFAGKSFALVLADPHGNDSNTFPMTLTP